MNGAPLLPTIKVRSWEPEWLPEGWVAGERYTSGSATAPFEVVVVRASTTPRVADATRVWKGRHGGRALDVLLAVIHGGAALVVGISDASHRGSVPLSRVAACCSDAMTATQPTALRSALAPLFAEEPTAAEGLTNKGLFATHALTTFGQRHPDAWAAAVERARGVRERSGTDVLTHLGWSVGMHGDAYVLRTDDEAHAVAVLLEGDEVFDRPSLRFGLGTSPVEHALALAAKQKVAWVQAVQGKRIRLYPVPHDLGVRRTGVTSYTEINLAHLGDDELGYVGLLLSPEALRDGGTAFQIVEESRIRATELGARLRERIYVDVVPSLAEAVARRMTPAGEALDERGLSDAYHRTLVILFRTLFVAYAEDRDLLPLVGPHAAGYDRVALKNRASEWARSVPSFSHTSTDLWDDLRAIWSAVHDGSTEWGIPAYGGSIFDDTLEDRPTLAGLTLTNAEIGPALLAMLVDKDIDDEPGPVDFGALSVREFGTIYEGLLESSLSVAPVDLVLDKKSVYVPAKKGQTVIVRGGDVYFHNASGARKATGSYFTSEFAVHHLLTTALTPTLDEHLASTLDLLNSGRSADASEKFFDFRVADIAMGSGHFLVGALDVIAERMSRFLADHPIESITNELDTLRTQATKALSDAGRDIPDIALSQESLLRRQIAKRCLYGVDINRIAVDLSRLALWIHTFVPGLPMSTLNHGLIHGNSLTGIGTAEEALTALEGGVSFGGGIQGSVFADPIEQSLDSAGADHARASIIYESSISELELAQRLYDEAAERMTPTRMAFDAAIAARLGEVDVRTILTWENAVAAGSHPAVRALVDELNPVHFPVEFPEVFNSRRAKPGFDVTLGNPPWDEVMVEEPKFWQRFQPGIMGLNPSAHKKEIKRLRALYPELLPVLEVERQQMARLRQVLLAGPYPQLGEGDVDYYKAFSWRAWNLLRTSGRIGMVFPRSILNSAGSAVWRKTIIEVGTFDEVCSLVNTKHWVFPDVTEKYTIALISATKTPHPERIVSTTGPFHSRDELDAHRSHRSLLDGNALLAWGDGAAFPLLPDGKSADIFHKFRRSPRLDAPGSWSFRPVREFDATTDRKIFDAGERTPQRWPVYTGASLNHWDPDFGESYAWSDESTVTNRLMEKRRRQARTRTSAFYGLPQDVVENVASLPCHSPRISYRDVTRATDPRTFIGCLIPPRVTTTNKAPYLLRRVGTRQDEAFLLGVLSSVPLDWYARRFVELSMAVAIVSALPIPQANDQSPFRTRTIEISGRLAAVDERFEEWAAEVGVPVGSVTDDVMKQDLVAELDALVSLLYDLERDDVVHIFETFHRGWDYQPRLTAVLDHFDRWSDQ